MSFWTALKTCNGPATFAVALLGNYVGDTGSENGRIGAVDVHTYQHIPGPMYVLSDTRYAGPPPLETQRVYVLAWTKDAISEVTFDTLNGYQYFLTSEFSGCRFVVTSDSVSHVAASAGGSWARNEYSQERRDRAEVASMVTSPTMRRRLSTSVQDGILDDAYLLLTLDNAAVSYDVDTERVMVFGYYENNAWHFKMLKYPTGRTEAGTWSVFI